ncbi:hypothetical protein BDK51DRAFT_51644 [Blyttiomyces helicus]|uniref:SH3 domain-containing protein n=1 Tax=Blyttiomyces helicus TaxID=388810 RepID=A0A4P9WB07_9FUNG|nr:hypothetical protein BDK51DRAFT_51644 [Blyttiomyces helicus]|eukprot:RKO88080.1 hypothetical protein BDK51DRAFT_51644 [Blyttiomyces helicus]
MASTSPTPIPLTKGPPGPFAPANRTCDDSQLAAQSPLLRPPAPQRSQVPSPPRPTRCRPPEHGRSCLGGPRGAGRGGGSPESPSSARQALPPCLLPPDNTPMIAFILLSSLAAVLAQSGSGSQRFDPVTIGPASVVTPSQWLLYGGLAPGGKWGTTASGSLLAVNLTNYAVSTLPPGPATSDQECVFFPGNWNVYCYGGLGSQGTALSPNTITVYDTISQKWSKQALNSLVNDPPNRVDAVTVLLQDSLYTWGKAVSVLSHFKSEDAGPPSQKPRNSFVPTGGTIINSGQSSGDGITVVNLTSTTLAVNVIQPPGTVNSTKPIARANSCAVPLASQNSFMIIGGSLPTGPFGDAWIYNVDHTSWSQVQLRYPAQAAYNFTPRASSSCDVVGSTVYVFGGTNNSVDFSDLWMIDTAKNPPLWTLVQQPPGGVVPSERDSCAFNAIGTYLVLTGGTSPTNPADDTIYVFDTIAQKWIIPPSGLPSPFPLLVPPTRSSSSSSHSAVIIGAAAGGAVVVIALIAIACCIFRRHRHDRAPRLGKGETFTMVPVPQAPTLREPTHRQVCGVINFAATQPDEMDFASGDIIEVSGEYEDGWAIGNNMNSGQSGAFPLTATYPLTGGSVSASAIRASSNVGSQGAASSSNPATPVGPLDSVSNVTAQSNDPHIHLLKNGLMSSTDYVKLKEMELKLEMEKLRVGQRKESNGVAGLGANEHKDHEDAVRIALAPELAQDGETVRGPPSPLVVVGVAEIRVARREPPGASQRVRRAPRAAHVFAARGVGSVASRDRSKSRSNRTRGIRRRAPSPTPEPVAYNAVVLSPQIATLLDRLVRNGSQQTVLLFRDPSSSTPDSQLPYSPLLSFFF